MKTTKASEFYDYQGSKNSYEAKFCTNRVATVAFTRDSVTKEPFLKPADKMLRQLVCSRCHCAYDVDTRVCYDGVLNSCFLSEYFKYFNQSCAISTNIT